MGDAPSPTHAAPQDDRADDLKRDGLGSPASGSSAARPNSAVWIIACSKSGPSAEATRSLPRYLPVSHAPLRLWCRTQTR